MRNMIIIWLIWWETLDVVDVTKDAVLGVGGVAAVPRWIPHDGDQAPPLDPLCGQGQGLGDA